MNLLIDAGNSRVKWAIAGPHYWKTGNSARAELGEKLKGVLPNDQVIEKVVISSTRDQRFNQQLSVMIKDLFDLESTFIVPERRQYDIINRYEPTTSLGADRWAALVAIRAKGNSPAIVIDSGTAVTIDAVNADGFFEGGVIFPGVDLALQALNQADNLRIAEKVDVNVFALSTDQAMFSGVMHSIAAAIDGIVQQMRKSLGYSVNVYLTGGNADHLIALLEHNVILEPDLVLRGLQIMAESNS